MRNYIARLSEHLFHLPTNRGREVRAPLTTTIIVTATVERNQPLHNICQPNIPRTQLPRHLVSSMHWAQSLAWIAMSSTSTVGPRPDRPPCILPQYSGAWTCYGMGHLYLCISALDSWDIQPYHHQPVRKRWTRRYWISCQGEQLWSD